MNKQTNVGAALNQLQKKLTAEERKTQRIIRHRAVLDGLVAHQNKKFTGDAKGKDAVVQFQIVVIEGQRLIPNPESFGVFQNFIHYLRLEEALAPSGDSEQWLPQHPLVSAAAKGNLRNTDGSKFFEPYPKDVDGMITIRRSDETTVIHEDDLAGSLEQIQDIRRQLSMELAKTKDAGLETATSATFAAAAIPFCPQHVIKRKKPEDITWKDTTAIYVIPDDVKTEDVMVYCITVTADGSTCYHVEAPEVFQGNKRLQRWRTIACKPDLPILNKPSAALVSWMQLFFRGLETTVEPYFPQDLQGSYARYLASPLGTATDLQEDSHRVIATKARALDEVLGKVIEEPAEEVPERVFDSPLGQTYEAPTDTGFEEEAAPPDPEPEEVDAEAPDWQSGIMQAFTEA